MRKIVIGMAGAAALAFAGFMTWNAEATPLGAPVPAAPHASLVERAGCWLPGLPGECEIGMRKACDHRGHCKCAPCPGWYPWRDNSK